MKSELKERYAKRYIRDGIITIILGLLLELSQAQNFMIQYKPVIELETLSEEEIEENMRVKMTVREVVARYNYTASGEAGAINREYIVPVNEYYIGVSGYYEDTIAIENNFSILSAYRNGDINDLKTIEDVEVVGTLRKIDFLTKDFYEDCIDDLVAEGTERGRFLPYAVYIGDVGTVSVESMQIVLFAGMIMIILGVFMLYQGSSRRYMRQILRYCNESENPEMEYHKLEKIFAGPMEGDYLRGRDDKIIIYAKNEAKVFDVADIIWVYQYPLATVKSLIIPSWLSWIHVFQERYLVLAMKNGKRVKVKMENDKVIADVMYGVQKHFPYLYFGYDSRLENLYIKNRQEMIDMVDDRKV